MAENVYLKHRRTKEKTSFYILGTSCGVIHYRGESNLN